MKLTVLIFGLLLSSAVLSEPFDLFKHLGIDDLVTVKPEGGHDITGMGDYVSEGLRDTNFHSVLMIPTSENSELMKVFNKDMTEGNDEYSNYQAGKYSFLLAKKGNQLSLLSKDLKFVVIIKKNKTVNDSSTLQDMYGVLNQKLSQLNNQAFDGLGNIREKILSSYASNNTVHGYIRFIEYDTESDDDKVQKRELNFIGLNNWKEYLCEGFEKGRHFEYMSNKLKCLPLRAAQGESDALVLHANYSMKSIAKIETLVKKHYGYKIVYVNAHYAF